MRSRRALAATFWLMVAVQTIGSVDTVRGKDGNKARKLPTPRVYVAPAVLWSILGLFAEMGEGQARAAARLSGLVVATAIFIGVAGPAAGAPAGQRGQALGERLTGFLDRVSRMMAPPGQGASREGEEGEEPPTTEV